MPPLTVRSLLRAADGDVLFLDQVGELGLYDQAVLLRAVEEKAFLPVGADRESRSDFQLISGTDRDLPAVGRFMDFAGFVLPGGPRRVARSEGCSRDNRASRRNAHYRTLLGRLPPTPGARRGNPLRLYEPWPASDD